MFEENHNTQFFLLREAHTAEEKRAKGKECHEVSFPMAFSISVPLRLCMRTVSQDG
jgi:hypothetical protein